MKFGIEYICTGNGGRSPTAQTIGRDYTKQLGLEDKVNIYSSGTGAESTEKNLFEFPAGLLLDAIEIAFRTGTFYSKAKTIAESLVGKKENTIIGIENNDADTKKRVEFCIRYLIVDEVAKRNNILLELGLVPEEPFHQQTNVRDDVQLILPMKQSNADAVKKIYDGSGYNPLIVPICKYAKIDGEISDPFGQNIEAYRKTRDLISHAVKKSIDRAIRDFKVLNA